MLNIPTLEAGIDIPMHAVAALFPLMEGEEFETLVASIRAHGQQLPCIIAEVELYDGTRVKMLVDGRNRWRGCRKAGIEPKVKMYDGDPNAIGDYIISLNVQRRHLAPGQIAMITRKASPFLEEEAATRGKATHFAEGNPGGPGRGKTARPVSDEPFSERDFSAENASSAAGRLAEKSKVSRYIAAQVIKVDKASPAMADAVARGTLKLNDAVRQLAAEPAPRAPAHPLNEAVARELTDALTRLRKDMTTRKEVMKVKDVHATISAILADYRITRRRPARSAAPKKPALTAEEWIAELEANPAYTGIDVRRELGKCQAWCETHKKTANRARFVNWLNRIDPPIGASPRKSRGQTNISNEPDGWRDVLRYIGEKRWDRERVDEWCRGEWSDLPLGVREAVISAQQT